MNRRGYDTAQICLKGHVITAWMNESPHLSQKYCVNCGSETITACPSCGQPIRGIYHDMGPLGSLDYLGYKRPAYCFSCGNAFPWVESSLEAAFELVEELEGLSQEEKQQLRDSFPDLIMDTPKTIVAETRFKRLMKKVGGDAYEGFRSILVEIVSETVRKSMFGP